MDAVPNRISGHDLRRALAGGMSLPPPGRTKDYYTSAVILGLAILAALLLVRVSMHLLYPFAIDIGEGTVLDGAWRAYRGEPVYEITGPQPPYFFTIYNPLLPYLAGLALKLFGPFAWAARLVTETFHFGAALVIYFFVRRETASRSSAVIAALFFLVARPMYSRAGYCVTDWPAIFFSLLGLYLWRRGGSGLYWAVGSFVLAYFSKQTSVIAAAAAFTVLFLESRRVESVKLFALFIALVAVGTGMCALILGRAYLVNTLLYASVAPFGFQRAFHSVGSAVALYMAPVVGWFFLASRCLRDRSLLLPVVYAAFGFLMALTVGRLGASRSYLFDFVAALAVLTGLMWSRFESMTRSNKVPLVAVVVVAAQMLLISVGTTYRLRPSGDRTGSDLARDTAIHEAFESVDGIILSRETGFFFNSRARPVSNDTHKIYVMIDEGRLSPEVLLGPTRQKAWAMVIFPVAGEQWQFFFDELTEEVFRNYTPVREEHGLLFMTPLDDAGNHVRPLTP